MELRHLRCFVAVAEELHFGRAAERLHVAQPAVSQTVKALERDLGVVLFERSNRRVELTDAGRAVLAEARAVLERFDAIAGLAERLRSGSVGRVTIGVSPAMPPNLLTELLSAFRVAAPDVTVVAKAAGGTGDSLAGLVSGHLDLALVRGAVDAPGFASIVVASEPVGVALPAAHRLAALDAVPAGDLTGLPVVAFPRTSDPVQFDRIFSALTAAGMGAVGELHESPAGAVEASLRLVAAGEAVSVKLASEVDGFGSSGVVWRPLRDVSLDVVVSLAWRSDTTSPATRRVVEALTAWGRHDR